MDGTGHPRMCPGFVVCPEHSQAIHGSAVGPPYPGHPRIPGHARVAPNKSTRFVNVYPSVTHLCFFVPFDRSDTVTIRDLTQHAFVASDTVVASEILHFCQKAIANQIYDLRLDCESKLPSTRLQGTAFRPPKPETC